MSIAIADFAAAAWNNKTENPSHFPQKSRIANERSGETTAWGVGVAGSPIHMNTAATTSRGVHGIGDEGKWTQTRPDAVSPTTIRALS